LLQLGNAHLAQYAQEGFTVVRQLITVSEAATVHARLMELRQWKHDWPDRHFQILDPAVVCHPDGGYVPQGVQLPAQLDPIFQRIAEHPNLQKAMASLLGGPVVRFTDQALIKNVGVRGESFYHQDSDYWHIPPEQGLNAWIALSTVDRNASALAILPGTKTFWEIQPHEEYFDDPPLCNAGTIEPFQRYSIPADQVDFSQEVLLPMAPGDAAFFSNYTWHRAEPNLSGRVRAAYAIAYRRVQEVGG